MSIGTRRRLKGTGVSSSGAQARKASRRPSIPPKVARVCGTLVAALLAGAMAAAPAYAAWGAPFALSSSGQNASTPQVAVDDGGDAVFVWQRVDASGDLRIQARARSATGGLSPVQTLSDAGQDASLPQDAVDADGDAVFTWLRYDGTTSCGGVGCFRVQARARSAAGILSGVQTLSDAGRNANDPQVAVDPNGDAVFAWTRYDGTNNRIQARARSAAGNLSIVQTLSTSGQNASNSQVAVDDGGDAVFTWERYDGAEWRAQTRARAAGLFLSPVQTLSDAGESALFPRVAVDADGDAVFTWRRFDGSGNFCCFRAQARARSAAGSLSAVQTLSTGGQGAFDPRVAVDPDGDAVFTWTRSDGTGNFCCSRVQAKARSAAGALSPVQYLSEVGQNAQGPRVAVDADGDAVFTWARSDGTNLRVQARQRSATGALSRPVQTLSTAGQDAKMAELAVDPTGDAVTTWRRSDGTNLRVQGAAGP